MRFREGPQHHQIGKTLQRRDQTGGIARINRIFNIGLVNDDQRPAITGDA